MGTIRIRVGHDNDLIGWRSWQKNLPSTSSTDGVDHGVDFLVLEISLILAFSSIKNLHEVEESPELHPSLLGRTAG